MEALDLAKKSRWFGFFSESFEPERVLRNSHEMTKVPIDITGRKPKSMQMGFGDTWFSDKKQGKFCKYQ